MHEYRPTIVHLSTVHHWDDSRIFRRMCLSLARNGHHVVLLAVSDGEQEIAGVHVLPVSFTRSRLARVFVNLPRAAYRAWSMCAAVYHLHDPELIPLIPVLRLRGGKVIYDAHEDLGKQILDKTYIPRAIRPAVGAAGRALCRFADRVSNHVVAASPEIAEQFRERTCSMIRNYPEELPESKHAPKYEDRSNRVIYVGGLTRARGVEQMIDAMQYAGLADNWRLLLVGPHSPEDLLRQLQQRRAWSWVEYHSKVPPPRARQMMGAAKIGLAVLQPIGQYVEALPTKLFEYMSVGLPVVAADYPQCRTVVKGAGCGLVVDPTDPSAIGEAIGELAAKPELAKEMGERGRAEVVSRFNWGSEEKRLLEIYAQLLGDSATGRW
jgi:glycosyltransferase involved in cell wall biosynthesis